MNPKEKNNPIKPMEEWRQLEKEVFERFDKSDKIKSLYEILKNVRYQKGRYEFDMILVKDYIPFAVVEIKKMINKSRCEDFVVRAFSILPIKYVVITDNNRFLLYEKNNRVDIKEVSFEEFEELEDKLTNANPICHHDKDEIEKLLAQEGMEKFSSQIDYEERSEKFVFKDNSEKDFFNKLLGHSPVKEIYKYASFDWFFSMIQNGKYRMCGIAGMNDPTEVDYFDKYVNNGVDKEKVDNNIFISSCCLLEDDLTMWRLYGDDAKGVCLTFKINCENENFVMSKVDYANKDTHRCLDIIKELINEGVFFKHLDRYKHFFKPYEYRIEKEYRILYVYEAKKTSATKHWVKTHGNAIVNPVIDFKFNDVDSQFPLQLSKITLGPIFPEHILNKGQIQEFVVGALGNSVCVENSKIENYR